MISTSYDIEEFLEALKGKELRDIVSMIDTEALEAWRRWCRARKRANGRDEPCREYEVTLKEFVAYLRASAKPKKPRDERQRLFRAFQENLAARKSLKYKALSEGRRHIPLYVGTAGMDPDSEEN